MVTNSKVENPQPGSLKTELIAVGYPEFHKLWGRVGEDPFAFVSAGGDIPRQHPGWLRSGCPLPNLNIYRGQFLQHLIEIPEVRK